MNSYKSAAIDMVAPIILMLFLGYTAGKYFDRMALCIISSFILGCLSSGLTVWKMMAKAKKND